MKVRLEVLEDPQSPYLNELLLIQKELLPDFNWNPANMLTIRLDEKKRPNAEIIMGFCNDILAGFAQIYYIYYYNKVFINVDFVAVLPQFRKSGLGLLLLRNLKKIIIKSIGNYICLGIIGLANVEDSLDPFSFKRLLLYSRLRAQIRRDVIYKTPDYPNANIVFYPASELFSNISTVSLAWQLWRISQYNSKQFKYYIDSIDHLKLRTELSKYK